MGETRRPPWDGWAQRRALLATTLASVDAAPPHLRAPLIREARGLLDSLDETSTAGEPRPTGGTTTEGETGSLLDDLRQRFAAASDDPRRHH